MDARYDEFRHDYIKVPVEEYEDDYQEYMERYKKKLIVISCEKEKFTIGDICNFSLYYRRRTDCPVVVFVDYLQLICGMQSDGELRKEMDAAVGDLKKLSITENIPIFAISSVGRASYGKGVGMASLKESGGLEFSGDCILGWDWCGVTDTDSRDGAENQKLLDNSQGFRKMKLSVLKNRNGKTGGVVYLKFYPAYNYFEEWTDERDNDPNLPFSESRENKERVF